MILTILEEHKTFYSMDKQYFFKKNSSNFYNDQLNYIKDKYIKKRASINEVNKFYDSNLEKLNIEKYNKMNLHQEYYITHETKEINCNKNDMLFLIEYKKDMNKIQYFFDLDKYYIINFKKEIMNCIFSIYYLDEFFYSHDFCVIKKYYINNYINKEESVESKKLDFPSVIKNYRNNFEPPLFVKKINNFMQDPLFPITHSYISENNNLKKLMNMNYSIKLKKKEIHCHENLNEIECELIRNEKIYFGKIFYKDSGNYLLFKEEKKEFLQEKGFKYVFLLSYFSQKEKSTLKKQKIIIPKKYDKSVLILFDEIEEIVEIRILLLWKGCEIFLKNGKSYIFNFLTTEEYDNFMKKIINNNKIKNLVRKRDFISVKKNYFKRMAKRFYIKL